VACRRILTAAHTKEAAMNRTVSRLLVPVVAVLALLGVMSPASAAVSPYCGITWGSQAKDAGHLIRGPITDLRAGRQECFDRLVVDIGGPASTAVGYRVEYVDRVTHDGSGAYLPLRGGAFLQIVVRAPGYNNAYRQTYDPANPVEAVNVAGFSTFRQVAWGGSFEGQSLIGLGVRARLPFRVFVLPGSPSNGVRVVVDVAHQW
jgi:hypothetical protein